MGRPRKLVTASIDNEKLPQESWGRCTYSRRRKYKSTYRTTYQCRTTGWLADGLCMKHWDDRLTT